MKKLQIAVGIIRNPNDEIFITQRAADAHMANKLEFPGGKIEAGETPEQALIRELQEEVGITPTQVTLFDTLEYQFPDRHITLWFWLVERWEGEPWGKEGQPGRWIAQNALSTDDFGGRPRRREEKPPQLPSAPAGLGSVITRRGFHPPWRSGGYVSVIA